MSKRCLATGGRPKAFWGALIGAAASLIGAGISAASASNNQRRALQAQKEEQERQNYLAHKEENIKTLNNYFASLKNENEEDRIVYKKGGRRRLRNAAKITDGGFAVPVGNDTYLLQGSSHSQINESGQTGIGINTGTQEVEAEGGEVIQQKDGELRVFSAQPMLNGTSPAQAVLEGANKDDIFKAQEYIKRKYSLANPNRRTALYGAKFGGADYIGLETNIGASILSGLYARSLYDDLLKDVNYTMPEYVEESFVSGPTKYYNAAQRANVERNRLNTRNTIGRNTASSAVGVQRMNLADTDAMYQLNELWDTKANKENEMWQENARRAQEVRARNAAARNQYYAKVAELKNQELATRLGIQQSIADSNVGMIQGIGSSIGNFLQSGIDNYQADQARRMQIAASQYGSAERMASMGVDFNTGEMRSLLANARDRYNQFATATDEDGIKNREAARQAYNFWLDRLARGSDKRRNKYTSRYSLSNV